MTQFKAMLAVLFFALAKGPSPGIPNFNRAVALEDKAETTANASLGDLNGDGYPDIVLAKGRHWPLVDLVLLNDGHGHFNRRHSVSDRADRSYTAALGDLNGDGTLDLVVGNDTPDEKVIYFNDGKGNFTFAGTFGDARWPTRNVTVVDLNGDGRPDIVVANRSEDKPGANYVCLNDGRGHFSAACRAFSTESATTIAAGDINGDGFPDLVVPHRDGGQSYLYINDGHGAFAERHSFGPANAETRAIALGDLNGDGKLDIIIGDQARGGAFIYFNQGSMKFSDAVQIVEKEDSVYSMAVADMNGDGHPDIVLGNEQAPGIVLINDGTGRKFTHVRFGDGQGTVYGVALGDVNGDGSPDIIAARSDAPSMLYLNSLVMKVRSRPSVKKSSATEVCPDEKVYTGKYRNLAFGFSIIIPKGLKGYWNSARCAPDEKYGCVCMGDHGRYIPLSDDALIEAFVGYEMEDEWTVRDYEKESVTYLRQKQGVEQVKLLSSKWIRLGGLKGRRFVVQAVEKNKNVVEDHIIALHKGVMYELTLRTLADRQRIDSREFEKVISSWRLTPRV